MSAWGGALIGGYESYNHIPQYFALRGDDMYSGSARGLIRGTFYPYHTIIRVPKVWLEEKPPWA